MSANQQISPPPLSLYVHIPWCVRKCPYCDFNSHAQKGELPEAAYIQALLDDFDEQKPFIQGRPLQSIFFGGGTPSLFKAESFELLLTGLKQRVSFANDIEITLEANPGTFEQERFKGFRAAGINRLSIGIQSFDDDKLEALGRIHSADEAQHAVKSAQACGFDKINIDLMHGLPGQSPSEAMHDLKLAIDLGPQHLSWYQLTIEPNTAYYAKPPVLPADEELWAIQEQGQALLAEHGFKQYEISAYSQAGEEARHNLNYWQFGDFIGIGAGAHGKITLADKGDILRTWQVRGPKDYLNPAKAFEAGRRSLGAAELPLEFMMNALRLNAGVPSKLFSERTGLSLDDANMRTAMTEGQKKGLLEVGEHLAPSEHGRLFLNNLLELFLTDEDDKDTQELHLS